MAANKPLAVGATAAARRPAAVPERAIQAQIMAWLRLSGWYVQRMNSGGVRDHRDRLVRLCAPGTPDVWALKDGLLLCVEVKRPGHAATPQQQMVMADLSAHGALCLVATCIEDVERALAQLDVTT